MKTESSENKWEVVFQQLKIAIAKDQYLEVNKKDIKTIAENKKKIEKMGFKVSNDNHLVYWDVN